MTDTRAGKVQQSQFPKAQFIAALVMATIAFGLLIYAYFQPAISADQRVLINFFYALVSGTAGFLWSGIAVELTGALASNRVVVKAFGGSAMAIVALWHPLFPVSPSDPPQAGIAITSPLVGATVQTTVLVQGYTTYLNWCHYILISGPGGDTVQDAVVKVSAEGDLIGRAAIGTAAAGAGQQYMIQIIASKTALMPGPLASRNNLRFSKAVPVLRASHSEGS